MSYYSNSELNRLMKRNIESLQRLAYSDDDNNIDAIVARSLFLFEELGEDISKLTILGDCIYGTTYCFLMNKKKMVIREDYEKHLKRKENLSLFLNIAITVIGIGAVVAGMILFIIISKRAYEVQVERTEDKIKAIQDKNDVNHVIDYGDPAPIGEMEASDIYDEIAKRTNSSSIIAVKDGDLIYFYTGTRKGTSVRYDEVNRVDDIFTIVPELTFTVEDGDGLYEDEQYYGMTIVDEYHNVMGTLYVPEDDVIEILGE